MRAPTASDAVATLVAKKMVRRESAADDRRAAALALTRAGRATAARIADWPDFLLRAVDTLLPHEQTVFLRGLVKMISALQEAGDIPLQRMCVSCRYFRPDAHPGDPARPHHCAFVDAAFGERDLRIDCPEHEQEVDARRRAEHWQRYLAFNHEETRT